MNKLETARHIQLSRQVAHWCAAAARLQQLDDQASPAAWNNLERYLGLSLRRHLDNVVANLNREAATLKAVLESAKTAREYSSVQGMLFAFRGRYLRTETTLNFFLDAINTRTSSNITGLLRACDILAHRSMSQLLDQLGKSTPVTLSYVDKGLGASILKAGLRLWDGSSINPVAAIKITRHNLYRPTALIHEAGHQVAHITGWNDELKNALYHGLEGAGAELSQTWSGWASEIAADAFAFVHTGYASIAALHDVIDGGYSMVFRHAAGDPHPVPYLRVLLGVQMCRQFYGAGPWDDLAEVWTARYPLHNAPVRSAALAQASLPHLERVAQITLQQNHRAFAGRSLSSLIKPERVKPEVLLDLERQLGLALYTSMHWIWTEALRLLALTGFQVAIMKDKQSTLEKQEAWMLRLGGALQAA